MVWFVVDSTDVKPTSIGYIIIWIIQDHIVEISTNACIIRNTAPAVIRQTGGLLPKQSIRRFTIRYRKVPGREMEYKSSRMVLKCIENAPFKIYNDKNTITPNRTPPNLFYDKASCRLGNGIPGLILILAWISNHIHYKVWDEITYRFLNFNGSTVEVWEWISNFTLHFTRYVITYPCCD